MGYAVGICELYHEKLHGVLSPQEKEINTHYLLLYKCKSREMKNIAKHIKYCIRLIEYLKQIHTTQLAGEDNMHDVFPNYPKLMEHCSPEIVEYFYLPSHHCICIKKTFWIKIIQRTWKRLFAERKRVILERSQYGAIRHREVFGRWPTSCAIYPRLSGMLSSMRR